MEEANSGHGFLADLARSVIADAQVADLGQLFRQVSMAGGNGHGNGEFIGAAPNAAPTEVMEMAEGADAAIEEPSPLVIPASTRQMSLF